MPKGHYKRKPFSEERKNKLRQLRLGTVLTSEHRKKIGLGIKNRKPIRYKISKKGCWIWQLSLTKGGYPKDGQYSKSVLGHRFYYEKYKGKIPKGLQLDHLCRNRACVNPDHLEPVTVSENQRRGNAAKLTKQQVTEIREKYKFWKYTQKMLAQEYRVSKSLIGLIIHRDRWKDV